MPESTARTLADMLRSRIERSAELKSETISLGQYFAHQIHHLLTEIGNGREHVSWRGDAPRDVCDPDRDGCGDWGLRARQVHLGGLSARAAGGRWFATTNGADGLCRIDNGAEMFPLIGEWPEAELAMELVNAYRCGQLHDATALAEAEARGRRQGLEWQPIETAPRDGTPIWAYLYETGIRRMNWLSSAAIAEEHGGSPDDYQEGFYEVDNNQEEWSPRFWLPETAITIPPYPGRLATAPTETQKPEEISR